MCNWGGCKRHRSGREWHWEVYWGKLAWHEGVDVLMLVFEAQRLPEPNKQGN